MECKGDGIGLLTTNEDDWNISRMECKVSAAILSLELADIGIYPEWNVKQVRSLKTASLEIIGIYPEWNVK